MDSDWSRRDGASELFSSLSCRQLIKSPSDKHPCTPASAAASHELTLTRSILAWVGRLAGVTFRLAYPFPDDSKTVTLLIRIRDSWLVRAFCFQRFTYLWDEYISLYFPLTKLRVKRRPCSLGTLPALIYLD